MDIQLIDWFFIGLYIFIIFYLAIKSGKDMHEKELTTAEEIAQEKFLANKSLTFFESMCSIIATEVSALTFIGVPAFAFKNNFSILQMYMGTVAARFLIAIFILPRVYDKGLTIYEVMAKDSGLPSGQRLVAIFYSLSKVVSIGVRLFTGTILVSQFFSVSVPTALFCIVGLTLIYTQVGGLKAVVRTDIFQLALFIFGGLLAHYLIPKTSGQSWGEMMSIAQAAGKTTFFDFNNPWPFVLGVLGGFLFDISTHGVDQDFAQRLTANKSMRGGQQAIFFSSFLSIAVATIFLGVGALLWVFYQTHPLPDSIGSDHIFPHFIINHFPVGIKGIMVAGVLSATMSVLDSIINALGATIHNDILPNRDVKKIKFYSLMDSIVIVSSILCVALFASQNDGLLMLGLRAQSWTGGTLLALFASKVLFKQWFSYQLKPATVLGAYVCGMGGVYINMYILEWDWNLNVYWGVVMATIFLKLYSTVKPMKLTVPS